MTIYTLTAIVYGWIEAFAMEHGFRTGMPNFFGFVKKYHGAMLVLAILIGLAIDRVFELAWWVLIEDLAFWASDKWFLGYNYRLTKDSWIVMLLGDFEYKNVMIPIAYFVLFVLAYLPFQYIYEGVW